MIRHGIVAAAANERLPPERAATIGRAAVAAVVAFSRGRRRDGGGSRCLDCVPNVGRKMKVDHAVSNSFAFGGLNAVLVFGPAPA